MCALFYLKCPRFSLLLAGVLLPYNMRLAYLIRWSYMFCLTCGTLLAGTALFTVCGSIFIFPYGGPYRVRFVYCSRLYLTVLCI